MSTRIYAAYRFPKKDITKVFSFIQNLKRELEKKYYSRTIDVICNHFEKASKACRHLTFNQFKLEVHEIQKNSRSYKANPESGMRYYIDSKYLYIKFWGDDDVLEDALKALEKKFKPKSFDWWNSTDKPENISEREWNARKRKWDEILAGRWDLGHLPYVELVPDYISKEDVPSYIYWANTLNESFFENFQKLKKEEKNKY